VAPLKPTWLHADRPTTGPTLDEVFAAAEPSLVDGDVELGPEAIADHVGRLAGALAGQGVGRGDIVAWQAPNCWEAVVLFRACWRLGAVAAPLHHLAGRADVAALLSRLDPAVVIDLDMVSTMVEHDTRIDEPAATVDDLALVLHTSGSSGEPKGVLHTHGTLASKARLMTEVHDLTPADTVLMPAPLAHISGLQNAVTVAGAAGMKAVLMPRWNPEHALDLIERHHVTFMIGPPTFFVSLRDSPGFSSERVASLRLISCGGAGVTPAFVVEATELFGAVVKRTYGSTEAPTVTTAHAGDDDDRVRTTDGHPTGAARIRLGPGDELWVRGPELFVGYTDPARTAEAIVSVEGEGADDGEWFRTGDIGRIDGDGWLSIVGRIHDIIIRGGENIAAAEVEAVLEGHPAVSQAVAVGEPDVRLGERVCAFVVCVEGATFDLATCGEWFEERGLTRFKVPERIVMLDALPLLAAGKPDRAALRRQAEGLASC
jgi:cyclohexanecarboxylate-CoA ligase